MWGVPSTCTTRTYWILLQTGFEFTSIWLAEVQIKHTHTLHLTQHCSLHIVHTWLIKGWCLGYRFLLFTVMATNHWDYCHLTLLSESMFLLENIFQLIIYCSLCAAIVTGQNQNWKLMTIIKSFDFLQNVKTFYKKVFFFTILGTFFPFLCRHLKNQYFL